MSEGKKTVVMVGVITLALALGVVGIMRGCQCSGRGGTMVTHLGCIATRPDGTIERR